MRLKFSTFLPLLLASPLCAQNLDSAADLSKHLDSFKAETMKAPLQSQDHTADIQAASQRAAGMTAERRAEVEKILGSTPVPNSKAKTMLYSLPLRFLGTKQADLYAYAEGVWATARQADKRSADAWLGLATSISKAFNPDGTPVSHEERKKRSATNSKLFNLRRFYVYGNLVPRTIEEDDLREFAQGWEVTISEAEYQELKRDYSAQTGLSEEELAKNDPL